MSLRRSSVRCPLIRLRRIQGGGRPCFQARSRSLSWSRFRRTRSVRRNQSAPGGHPSSEGVFSAYPRSTSPSRQLNEKTLLDSSCACGRSFSAVFIAGACATTATVGSSSSAATASSNPLFVESTLPYSRSAIRSHSERALPAGARRRNAAAAGGDRCDREASAAADVRQYDRRDGALGCAAHRAANVFFAVIGANTNDTLQKIDEEVVAEARRAQRRDLPERSAVSAASRIVYDRARARAI